MKSVLFIQSGDFGEAYQRFSSGGEETYRDQKKSVDFVAALAKRAQTTTISFSGTAYKTELASGLHAIGLSSRNLNAAEIQKLLDETAPNRVILRSPHAGFLKAVNRRRIPVLPIFADIFRPGGPRGTLRNIRLRYLLARAAAPCISNHSLNASLSLAETLKVPQNRIVPWDWSKVPILGAPKTSVADPSAPTAFYAGILTEAKGVGDCILAVATLKQNGIRLSLRLAGHGDPAPWQAMASTKNVADQVIFIGSIPNAQVRTEMQAHDFVIVPSRHSYPEGLPNTIYEGLASQSVLVISDHPAFRGRLKADSQALIFPAGNPKAMADCLQRAIRDTHLYAKISAAARLAHDDLYIGMEWSDLVTAFLEDPQDRDGWVKQNTLAGILRA